MAALDPISALEYNNIRSSIAQIVGNFAAWTDHGLTISTTGSGYGRGFTSSQVVGGNTLGVSDTVTEQQYFDMYLDLQAAHLHQYGTLNGALTENEFEGKTSFPDVADVGSRDTIAFQQITDLNTIAAAVNAFNHSSTDFPSSNFTTDLARTSGGVSITSTRSAAWGGSSGPASINHEITLDFGTHNAMLYFLAAGGEIRFDASLAGGTSGTANTKDWDWARILAAMGTIRFGRIANTDWRCEAISPGSGTGYSSNTIATSSPGTLIFEKQGGGVTGGASGQVPVTQIYDDNFYRIFAWTNTTFSAATQLIFNIILLDGDTGTGGQDSLDPGEFGTPVDEPVTGTITSNVYTYTPDSELTIDSFNYPAIVLPAPIGTINSSL